MIRFGVHWSAIRAAFSALAVVLSSSGPPVIAHAQTAFYTASKQELKGHPGTIIRQELMSGAPSGAVAHRLLYRSTGLAGEPIAISGVVIIPVGAAPAGGRPVVAWVHPTTGVAPPCAPSLQSFVFQTIQGLQEMVQHGYVVVATDYPGLGTVGPHPYLVGASAAHAVLDSVRAARRVAGAGIGRGFVVWGHSQGGHAALYAGLLARRYAPDLILRGVAAAAPATQIAPLLNGPHTTAIGRSLVAMMLWSWAQVYGAPIDQVIAAGAMPAVEQLVQICMETTSDLSALTKAARPLEQSFLTEPKPADAEPWHSIAVHNTPGPLPSQIPVFLAQGSADEVVPPAATESYMRRLCEEGSSVRMVILPGVDHSFIAHDSAAEAVTWMADRFAGRAASNDCGK